MRVRSAIAVTLATGLILGLILRPFAVSMALVFFVLALVTVVIVRDAFWPDRTD